jgi:hypothetical protein
MEVRNGIFENGGQVGQSDDVNIFTQQWFIYDTGNGYFEFVNANSGLALDVDGTIQQRTFMRQFERNNTASQRFQLIPLS